MTKLAKTRSSLLKEVLQDLDMNVLEPLTDSPERSAGWKRGYIKALEDVWKRMEG